MFSRAIMIALSLGAGSFARANINFDEDPGEANYFELALNAYGRSAAEDRPMQADASLTKLGLIGINNMRAVCGRGDSGKTRNTTRVTAYYIPLLNKYKKGPCKNMEGVCRYKKDGIEYLANYGQPTVKLKDAFCKNGIGYGIKQNCTHPCRSLAASTRHHNGGEVIFFPELVGKTCGTGRNRMIHDGFMVVNDTGDARRFNKEGRFDFFWGECKKFKKGVCLDPGAIEITRILSGNNYCRAWRAQDPLYNKNVKVAFYNAVRSEAIARGDNLAASAFDLDLWTLSDRGQVRKKLATKFAYFKAPN